VDVVPVYETKPASREVTRLRALLEARGVDAITFTSASTVHSFCDALGESAPAIVSQSGAIVASIGPITSEAAVARGLDVRVTAATYTLEGLLTALEPALR
jgi:uroporphyrinogen-III synthase